MYVLIGQTKNGSFVYSPMKKTDPKDLCLELVASFESPFNQSEMSSSAPVKDRSWCISSDEITSVSSPPNPEEVG